MFADIAAYTRSVISLYLNEDSDSGGCDEGYASCGSGTDEYLFNNQTISGRDEEMPRPLAPPLFSYC